MTYLLAGGVSIPGFAMCSVLIITSVLPFLSFFTSTFPDAAGFDGEDVSGKVFACAKIPLSMAKANDRKITIVFRFISHPFQKSRLALPTRISHIYGEVESLPIQPNG